jgi:hypothetical protein
VILWGSSAGVDYRSVSRYVNDSCVLCANIQDYLSSVAGPVMAECVAEREKCAMAVCSGHRRCASQFALKDAVGVCKSWAGVSSVCATLSGVGTIALCGPTRRKNHSREDRIDSRPPS